MLLNADECQLVLVDYQTRLQPAIFEGAHNIPLRFKTMGNLERRMIQKLNPAVAACPSA